MDEVRIRIEDQAPPAQAGPRPLILATFSVRIDPPSSTPRTGVGGGLATIVARDVLGRRHATRWLAIDPEQNVSGRQRAVHHDLGRRERLIVKIPAIYVVVRRLDSSEKRR